MARLLESRLLVHGKLSALDPLHVGSGQEDSTTDMAVVVDGRGRLQAPGAGLAGAFQAWCRRRFPGDLLDRAWGYQLGESGAASHLFIEDALIQTADGAEIEVRDHVGIDRQWGTAAPGIKFDRAVIPQGSKIDLEMSLDLPLDDPQGASDMRAVLGYLLQSLQAGRIRLGGAKSRGLGRVQLIPNSLRITSQPWTRRGVIERLTKRLAEQSPGDLIGPSPMLAQQAVPTVQLRIGWRPVGPLMVKSGIDGLRIDTLPLLGGTAGGLTPIVPGSSWKGILRSQAERILRTVLRCDPDWRTAKLSPRRRFLAQLDEDLPLVQMLFGARGGGRFQNAGLGALAIADCFARNPRPTGAWDKFFYAPSEPRGNGPGASLKPDAAADQRIFASGQAMTGRTAWQVGFHNAVDRWTGGAADSALYQILEPWGEDWNAVELELDVDRIGRVPDAKGGWKDSADSERDRQAAWFLLLLTLRDLARQRIPIGFGGNRGFGEIEVTEIVVLPIEGNPLGLTGEVKLGSGDFARLDAKLRSQWTSSWTEFITDHSMQVSHG